MIVASGRATEKQNLAAARKLYAAIGKRDQAALSVLADDVVDFNQTMADDAPRRRLRGAGRGGPTGERGQWCRLRLLRN